MEYYKDNQIPDQNGRYGDYGGQFVPETLMAALSELTEAFEAITNDRNFSDQLNSLLKDYDVEIGGGLGPFAGKVWRIGLMGYSAKEENVRKLLKALNDLL